MSASPKSTLRGACLHPLFWIAGTAALLLTSLYSIGLIPIDETRYAGVAWEMLQQGHALVPHNNGQPYADKPPLLFWLLAAGWGLFGPSIAWARAVPTLFSLASLGMTALLARCLWPRRATIALTAPTVLLGFVAWALWTPLVLFDVLLAFWTLTAITGVALAGFGRRRWGWLLVAAGLGLGCLTKGPVALLIVLPPVLLAPAWVPEPRLPWRRWYAEAALATGAAIVAVLAWAVPAAMSGGADYASAIFWDQSAGRVSESFAHQRPFWWYLPWLPALLLPWCLWASGWRALARLGLRDDRGVRLLLCWIAPVFLLFSAIGGKQVYYLLPLLPGAALWLARALADVHARPAWASALPMATVVLGVAVVTHPAVLREIASRADWIGALPAALPWALAAVAGWMLIPAGSAERRTLMLALASVTAVALLVGGGLRAAWPRFDLSRASRMVAEAQRDNIPVAYIGAYHDRFQFLGRLTRPLKVLTGSSEVDAWAADHPGGLVALDCRAPPQAPGGSRVVLKQPFRGHWLAIVRLPKTHAHPRWALEC